MRRAKKMPYGGPFLHHLIRRIEKIDKKTSDLILRDVRKEITKLRKWIVKHQEESIPPHSQSRLFNDIIMKYVTLSKHHNDEEQSSDGKGRRFTDKELLQYKEDSLIPLLEDYLAFY